MKYQDSPVVSRKAKKKQHAHAQLRDYRCVIYSYQRCKISKHCNLVVLGTTA